jgi:prolyl 3-hydroxylase /prolyl 3,4-dihydroxylase
MFNMQKQDLRKLNEKFKKSKPFPHVLIENFLSESDAKKLQIALKKEPFTEKDSDLFHLSQTNDLETAQRPELKDFYEFVKSQEFADFMRKLTGILVEPSALDVAGSLYKNTNYLLCHDDKVEDRKVAYIYYLSEDFDEKDGGALALLEDVKGKPGKVAKRYYPQWNNLMVFAVSNKSWHAVEEVIGKKDRYAIGGWLR